MKKTLVLTVLLFGLFSFMFAQMQGHDCYQNPGKAEGRPSMMQKGKMGNHFVMMRKELDLSEKQLKEMEANRLENAKEIAPLEAELKIAHLEHQASMKNHDYKKAKSFSEKMSDIKKQIASKRIDLKEQQWKILTKEQQEKWEELKLEHPHRPMQPEQGMKRHPGRK